MMLTLLMNESHLVSFDGAHFEAVFQKALHFFANKSPLNDLLEVTTSDRTMMQRSRGGGDFS